MNEYRPSFSGDNIFNLISVFSKNNFFTSTIFDISLIAEVPIINGILTTDNVKQAMSRSNMNGVNKGWDAMEAALSTILTYNEIKRSS